MKSGFFICLIGIDGSGKTTLANKTIGILTENKLKSKYLYCGWRQFSSLLFKPFVKLMKILLPKSKWNRNIIDDEYIYSSKVRFSNIFKFVVMVDYYAMIIPKLVIPLAVGINIVCDRYFYDVLINTGLDLNNSNEEIRTSIKKWQHLFPKPDLIFLIDVPEDIAYTRKKDIPSEDYLNEHRRIFLSLVNDFNINLLDGTWSIEMLEKSIKGKVSELLGEK